MSSATAREHESLTLPLLPSSAQPDDKSVPVSAEQLGKALLTQARLATPLVINYVALYAQQIVVLAFVGQLGTTELAAVAFGNTLVTIVARLVLIGLSGGLDTQASQAYGAGNYAAIPVIFQRTLMFLWAHCILISAVLLLLPELMQNGESGDHEFAFLASKYLMAMMPSIWVDAVNRVMNRILVCQRVTLLQMWVAVLVLPLHGATTYFLITHLNLGYLGGAVAMLMANTYVLIFTSAAVMACGMQGRVWGTPSWGAWQGWQDVAVMAYPACVMKCAESWGFSSITIWAGFLPDPTRAVAAVAVAFSIQGTLFMPFAAAASAVTATVGNALGAGDVRGSKAAAMAAVVMSPLIWMLVAIWVLEPHCKALMLHAFGGHGDEVLEEKLKWLLLVAVVLELFDGTQTMMAGVIQGCGKQRFGAAVNLVSFYILAIPLSLTLAFYFKYDVYGLYGGMVVGPMFQLCCYIVFISRIHWRKESEAAVMRSAQVLIASPATLPTFIATPAVITNGDAASSEGQEAAAALANGDSPADEGTPANGSGAAEDLAADGK